MKRKLRKLETSILFIIRFALNFLLFFVFYGMYARSNWQLFNISRTSAVTIATYIVVSYMFANIYGRYDIGKRKSRPIVHSLFLASIFTDLLTLLMLSIMNTNASNNKSFVVEQPFLLIPILAIQYIIIWIFAYGGNKLYFMIYEPEKCLIITSSQRSLNEVIRGIRKYKLQYKINLIADYHDKELKKYITTHDTIFIYDVPIKERTDIIEFCYQNMKNVYFNPDMHDVVEKNSHHILLDDLSMYGNYSKGLTLEQRAVKRIEDIIISVIALVITSPLLLISAILIKIEDKGSIIFKQNRATRNGKIFSVYKLRTMREDVENYSAIEDDERVTKVGRVLRKYRIDELPQFFNVLKGDMSVVGPRPEMLANIFNYTSMLPAFEYRLRVKAGITGHAQIAGKYNTSPRDKLILDLMYIEEYSMWLDIKLLFQTFIVLLKRDSTEAFKDEEMVFKEYSEDTAISAEIIEEELNKKVED
ncbi:MAG: exopolysaccharide biosynthesis polyprenyl glycosylphosphotransferase [Lachnospiraceae bacterium]|nr:exopolysaccharide biosynthesis polyprenyl glycosylphosphotransferase [Lachnospiraceae bacterium]